MKKTENKNTEYELDAASIDRMGEEIRVFLQFIQTDEKDILRIKLSAEEMLLNWQEHFGAGEHVFLKTGVSMGKPFLILELKGEEFNPLCPDEEQAWMRRLLSDLEAAPTYTYQKKTNRVTIHPKKKRWGLLHQLLLAILLGAVLSLATTPVPQTIKTALVEQGISPLLDKFFGLIGMLAGPLIFLSVFTGITGIGNLVTFSSIGKKGIQRSLLYTWAGTLLAVLFSIPAFGIHVDFGGSSVSAMGDIFQLILDIFPTNLLDAFLQGNVLQIIILGILFGVAALMLGARAEGITRGCEVLRIMVSTIMGWMCCLVPLLVFLTIVENAWSGNGKIFLTSWKPILIFWLLAIGTFFVSTVWVSTRLGTGCKDYLKKILPPMELALATSSSSTALSEINTALKDNLGIQKNFVDFAMPLYLVLMGMNNAFPVVVFTLYAAVNYQMSITIGWVVIELVSVALLSSATPPIAGAGLTIYTILFAQLGIPGDIIPVILTIDILCDFVNTGLKVGMIENETVLHAWHRRLLDANSIKR